MAQGERGPEQGMRHPHLGREAENEGAEASGRTACLSEDDTAFGAVSRPCRREPEQLGPEKKKAVDDNSALGILRQMDVGFGGHIGEEIDEQAVRNVVPEKRPRI